MATNDPIRQHFRQFDALVDDTGIELKAAIRGARGLRSAMLELVYRLAENPDLKAVLVLVDPGISLSRIDEEEAQAKAVMQPGIMSRIQVVVVQDGCYEGLPDHFSRRVLKKIDELVRQRGAPHGNRLPRPDYHFVIRQILILQWLRNAGPMTADWLAKSAGCTYPTVASSLKRIEHLLMRHSDRRFELRQFPVDEWSKMTATSDRARSSIHFADRSGQPRAAEDLLRRFMKTPVQSVTVGGVFGAKFYYPDLDIVGSPRLDLTLHCPSATTDWSFVKQLDPALEPEDDPRKPIRLALHFLRRHEALSNLDDPKLRWSDPVECMLDLHESRLEAQEIEFFNALLRSRESRRSSQ